MKNKTLTCFPSWFEKEIMFEANYGKLLPFDMEEELERRGANLKRVDKETRSNGQIVDAENRTITASSATEGEFISEEVIKLLKKDLCITMCKMFIVAKRHYAIYTDR